MRSAKWGMAMLLASWAMPFGLTQGKAANTQQQSDTQQQSQQASQASQQKQSDKQGDALAEASRRAREGKREQPKASKVFDNDNLPKTPGSISVVGEGKAAENATAPAEKTEAANTSQTAAPQAKAGGNEKVDEQKKAELEKELAGAKEHLQTVTTDLDIATRKYALDQQTYYGKPNFAADEEGAAALKVEAGVVDSKKQELADAQQKVADLEAKLKELESGSAKPE